MKAMLGGALEEIVFTDEQLCQKSEDKDETAEQQVRTVTMAPVDMTGVNMTGGGARQNEERRGNCWTRQFSSTFSKSQLLD